MGVEINQEQSFVACSEYGQVSWMGWTSCHFRDEVAIFRFRHSEDGSGQMDWHSLLDADEIEKGWRYHRRDDRLRSLYTRSLLRILIGKYTDKDPLSVRLARGKGNKPELKGDSGLHINATHSGSWILLAIGRRDVGIDVEEVKPDLALTDMIPTVFSDQEQQYVEFNGETMVRFYELWTRKEALVKAFGSGIDENFPHVPALNGYHTLETNKFATHGEWTVNSFHVARGYQAAVAYRGNIRRIHFYTLDHGIFSLHKNLR